jgi:OmcA/MtrC family decaheme c-type cytochrome
VVTCPANGPGGTSGLTAKVIVSGPANGNFFAAGERPVLTITFTNGCGQLQAPADLSSAELFVYGPRAPLATVTAYALENFAPAPFSAQSLKAPKYASDGGAPNMTVGGDNTVTYTLNPISTEAAGTYTAAVWTQGANTLDQDLALADFQIGTATVETFVSGPADGSSCRSCHTNAQAGGKTYMAHIAPGFSPVGNYALDAFPIGSCKACHNNAGYSPNTILRKAHAVHRGSHQLAPGAAHPEYNEPFDGSLAGFLNVNFPATPVGGSPGFTLTADLAMEKDCTACHVNGAWRDPANISRAACGACHDNVFFAGPVVDGGVLLGDGVISPPTVLGPPPGTSSCTVDADCSVLASTANVSWFPSCNTSTGNCELTFHQQMLDDTMCASCHAAGDPTVDAPVDLVHGIAQWQPPVTLDGDTFKNVTVTGGSGSGGFFQVGDKVTLKFQLFDGSGAAVADLATNSTWAGTFLIAGPTSNPQRVFGAGSGGLSMKNAAQGTLSYDGTSQTYTYAPTATWPLNSLAPVNNPGAGTQPNPAGSYTVWFYWARTTAVDGGVPVSPASIRDAVDAQVVVAFGGNQPKQARQVVTQAGCASCHMQNADGFPHLALHGDQRKNGETCSVCHSQNALDRGVGSTGVACTTNSQCPGNAAGWESCVANVCTVTADPTPGIHVDYQQLVHDIHFARLREGYVERNNLVNPGTLQYLGFNNSLLSFQEILSPVDVRSCNNCHRSTLAACSVATDCGYGQSCVAGKCQNTAFLNPTARACITCHDAADAAAHAAANTYVPSGGGAPIESCPICHGPGAQFAVDVVHNITTQYPVNLAYPREP